MEEAEGKAVTHTVSGVSFLLGVITFLAMWGGLTLLCTAPAGAPLPPFSSSPRGLLASFLLFWVPIGTGTFASLTGLMGLSARSGNSDARRRALVGLFLGLAPAYLAAVWLAWVLAARS